MPARTPAGVRAALRSEDLAEFEQEYRASLAEAAVAFDLMPVQALVERWWRVAVSASDPAAHRRMLTAVADLREGRPAGGTPWRQALADSDG